jgi:hypothetical protein
LRFTRHACQRGGFFHGVGSSAHRALQPHEAGPFALGLVALELGHHEVDEGADLGRQVSSISQKIVASDEYRKYLASMGLVPIGGSPKTFATVLQVDSKRWMAVVRNNNISLD